MAQCQITWDQCGTKFEVPERTRPVPIAGRLDCLSLRWMKRPVQSRIQGLRGGAGLETSPNRLCDFFDAECFIKHYFVLFILKVWYFCCHKPSNSPIVCAICYAIFCCKLLQCDVACRTGNSYFFIYSNLQQAMGKNSSNTTRISITVPKSDYETLVSLSGKPHPSISSIASLAISTWLESHKGIKPEQLSLMFIQKSGH